MDDDTRDPRSAQPQGQLLTGAYWLDSLVYAGDECMGCTRATHEEPGRTRGGKEYGHGLAPR
ncbi:hypothetical protein ACWGII_09785 [Streptomyces sp. NPDC054855]